MDAGRWLAIEGQLLRAEPRSSSEISAITALRSVVAGANAYMALSIGWTEPWASSDGAPSEVQCVIPADDSAVRQRVAALKPGAPVLVQGSPAGWSAMPGGTAIVLGSCKFAP